MKLHFADCHLDTDRHELVLNGQVVEVEPKIFDLVCLLAVNAGRLITKDELQEEIWNGRIVSEGAISACITAARKAVGDNGKDQRVIKTVAKRGLQLVAEVTPSVSNEQRPDTAGGKKPSEVNFARCPDGATLAYSIIGSGPPLVRLAHFPAGMREHWEEGFDKTTLSELSKHHSILRFDFRGSGLSENTLENASPEDFAEDLLTVVNAAGWDEFALMGMSGSALTAVAFASNYPDRVTRLILQAGFAEGREIRTGGESDSTVMLLEEGVKMPSGPFGIAYASVFFPSTSKEWQQRAADAFTSLAPLKNTVLYRKTINKASIVNMLPRVNAPTLVLHSTGDSVHPISQARELASRLTDARLVPIESPNHFVLPDEAGWNDHVDAILQFLRGNKS